MWSRSSARFRENWPRRSALCRSAAEVSFGYSEKDAVYREDKLTLYRYWPIADSAGLPPVLIVYALVNRPYDGSRARSLADPSLAGTGPGHLPD
jgi:hypothetical protein